MGKVSRGSRGIHGDTPATSQAQANASCFLYNFIPGINLFEVIDNRNSKTVVNNDVTNRIPLLESTVSSVITNVLNDTPNRIGLPEANVGVGNTTGLS